MTEPTPRAGRPARSGATTRPVTIRATESERTTWQAAADREGIDLSNWLRAGAMLMLVREAKRNKSKR